MSLKSASLDVFRKAMQDPELVTIISDYTAKMNRRFWSYEYLSIFTQNGSATEVYQAEDAHFFMHLHAALYQRKLALASIYMGEMPHRDRDVLENNRALAQLRYPFSAEFSPQVGAGANDDGDFAWQEPVVMQVVNEGRTGFYDEVLVRSNSIPLEVGRTSGWRTLLHVSKSGGVARWPYGSKHIYVLHRIDQDEDIAREGVYSNTMSAWENNLRPCYHTYG